MLKLCSPNHSSVLILKVQRLFFLSMCDIFYELNSLVSNLLQWRWWVGVSFTNLTSHFGCVPWSILLLCWFGIQLPVFTCRTLDAPFLVVLSCRNLCLRLFLYNAGTDCLYLWKLVFSHLPLHLSKVICVLIFLTLYKDMSVLGGRWEDAKLCHFIFLYAFMCQKIY